MQKAKKYGGKDLLNNRVVVDYTKKTVKFIPLKSAKQSQMIIIFILAHLMIYMFLWVYSVLPFAITYGILRLFGQDYEALLNLIFAATITAAAIATTYRSLFLTIKRFRNEEFPEYNIKLSRALRGVMRFGLDKSRDDKYMTINKKTLNKDNTILIPFFTNMQLNYKATKDFAKQLKEIRIEEIYKNIDKEDGWFARITFKKRPKTGQIQVQYI